MRLAAALVLGAGLLAFVALAALVGPLVWPVDPIAGDLAATFAPPLAGGHPLGTDQLGRDLLARILAGTRLPLAVIWAAGMTSGVLGPLLAVAPGFFGGGL